MKKIKKITAVFLAFLMIISAVPLFASATTTSDKFVYEIIDGEVIISFIHPICKGELIVPPEIEGYPVVSIEGKEVDLFYSSVESIILPETITNIGDYAFICPFLKNINIPNSVTNIGNSAFYCCQELENINIPNSVIHIGDCAFNKCRRITSIVIPESVTSIGKNIFSCCDNLLNIVVEENNPVYDSRDNCNALIETETNTLIAGQYNSTIPDSVTKIAESAFKSAYNLKEINIPESVTSIGNTAFSECFALSDVYVNWTENIPAISDNVFDYTTYDYENSKQGITTLHVPAGTKELYESTDGWCNFQNIVEQFPDNEKYYLNDSIYCVFDKSAETLTIGGTGYIPDCKLYENYTTSQFYYNNPIKNIIIENGITGVGDYAFYDCDNLKNISISDSVKNIGEYSFAECYNLLSVEIPDSVTEIGENAFYHCTNLQSATISGGIPSISYYAFACCDNLTDVIINSGVTEIADSAFSSCPNLTNITIPESVEVIGDSSFTCSGIKNLVIPSGVVHIGSFAFGGCANLENITISDTVETIGDYAFGECLSLTDIVIPDSVTSIGEMVFECCENLSSITLGKGITNIYSYAFFCCYNLTAVYYNGTESQWNTIEIEDGNEDLLNANIHFFDPYAGRVDNVILSSDSETLRPDETLTLTATVLPEDAVNKNILWSSSNEDIVSVEDGVVTAYGVGTAYITVETEDGGFRAVCRIKVAGIVASSGSTVIDTRKNLIYGLAPNLSSIDEFVDMTDSDAVFEYDSAVLGTGSVVNIVKDGEIIDSYEIVVFGDTDGDAWYDGADSVIVNCIANGLLTEEQTGSAVYTAADCNHDGVVDSFDVEILERAGLILSNVDQTKSAEELAEDSVYAEYLNLISQTTVEEAAVEEAPVEEVPEVKPAEKTFIQKVLDFFMNIFNLLVLIFNK